MIDNLINDLSSAFGMGGAPRRRRRGVRSRARVIVRTPRRRTSRGSTSRRRRY